MSDQSANIERVDNGFVVQLHGGWAFGRKLVFSDLGEALSHIAKHIGCFEVGRFRRCEIITEPSIDAEGEPV